jgi:hypothetical protein
MTAQSIGQVAGKIVNRWAWYFDALANPAEIGKTLPIHDGDAQQGYYRVLNKQTQRWEPVAIFYPDGSDQIVAYQSNREVDAGKVWSFCCRNPIRYEVYQKAVDGGGFDDEPPAPRGIGDNSAANDDPREALWLEFLGEKETAEEFLKKGIKTQEDADKASIWKDRILKIKSRAAALFKAEKQPVLDDGKRIDDRWRALAHDKDSDTAAMVEKLRLGMESFLKAKKAEEEARQRKAREEEARIRREAEEAAAKARRAEEAARAAKADAGQADGPSPEDAAEMRRQAEEAAARLREAQRAAEARTVSAGRTGARTGIRTEKKGEIVDRDAFYQAVRDRAEVTELLQSLANRAAKSGFELAGMKIVEVEKVV